MKNKELAVIVRQVQKDKDKYYEKLFVTTWETVYYLSLKMMNNESDAEDVSQEIFVKIYNNIDKLDSPEAFNRWMNRIVMNTCNRALSNRTNKLQSIDNEDIGQLSNLIEEDYTEFLPAELADNKETKAIIERMIQELPEKQKQAVLMYYYEQMSTTEIAQTLDCAITAVKKRLHNAKVTLRLKIEDLQEEQDIKLYSISGLPVLTVILKACATEACTNSAKASLWSGVVDSVGIGVGGAVSTSSIASAIKLIKSNSTIGNITSAVGSSTVSQIAVVVVTVALTASSIFISAINNQTKLDTDGTQYEETTEVQTQKDVEDQSTKVIEGRENEIEDFTTDSQTEEDIPLSDKTDALTRYNATQGSDTDSTATTQVTATAYNPPATYFVTIPATIEFGNIQRTELTNIAKKEFNVSLKSQTNLFEREVVVKVSTTGGVFQLTSGIRTLTYKMFNVLTGGLALSNNDEFCRFNKDTVLDAPTKGRLELEQMDIREAGLYEGTVTFTISLSAGD